MKFSNDNRFFVISNNYIDYLIRKDVSRSFYIQYKDNYEVCVKVEVKEFKNVS